MNISSNEFYKDGEMAESIKKNSIMVIVRNMAFMVFPLITFPYLSRILGPEGMGKINFASSFSNYFAMVASLGIPMYGAREIARVREDNKGLNKVFSEIFIFNVLTTIIVFVIYIFVILMLNKTKENILFFIVYGVSFLINVLCVEWLFTGLEKFSYISIRAILCQILFIILTFLFVKSKKDVMLIPLFLLINVIIQVFFNLNYSRKYIKFVTAGKVELKKHMKPVMTMFAGTIATAVYMSMDIVMLGLMKSDWNVGVYSASIRINGIVLGILTSLSGIFYSRLSNYYKNNKEKEAVQILNNWGKCISIIIFPVIAGLYITADEFIPILAGKEYGSAVITSRLMLPMLFFSVVTNYIGVQLYSKNKEKQATIIIIVTVLIGLLLNFLLIPKYAQNGAAISKVIMGLFGYIAHLYVVKKNKFTLYKMDIRYPLMSLFMLLCLYFLKMSFNCNIIIEFIVMVVSGILIYGTLLIINGDIDLKKLIFQIRRKNVKS